MKRSGNLRFFLGFVCVSLLFAACGGSGGGGSDGDDDDNDDNPTISYSGVHIVGQNNDVPMIWIDDEAQALPVPAGHIGNAYGVALNGADVYVAGYHKATDGAEIPCVWVNGVRTDLMNASGETAEGAAYSVAVLDYAVLVSGTAWDDTLSQNIPVCWIFGVDWNYSYLAGGLEGAAVGVAVDSEGGTVFAGKGLYLPAAGQEAFYWDQDEEVHFLTPAGYSSIEVTGVCARGTEIVVVGRYSTDATTRHPCYWLDGTIHELTDGDAPQFARSVAVKGNSILVAGECDFSTPGIWTDGVWTSLPLPDYASGFATAIAVSGSDVYVGGSVDDEEIRGCFWKNGQRVDISGLELVNGIAVK